MSDELVSQRTLVASHAFSHTSQLFRVIGDGADE